MKSMNCNAKLQKHHKNYYGKQKEEEEGTQTPDKGSRKQ